MDNLRAKLTVENFVLLHIVVYPIISSVVLLGQSVLRLVYSPNTFWQGSDSEFLTLFYGTGALHIALMVSFPVLLLVFRSRSLGQLTIFTVIFFSIVVLNSIIFFLEDYNKFIEDFPQFFWPFFFLTYIYLILNVTLGISLIQFGEKIRLETGRPAKRFICGIGIRKLLYPHLFVLLILLIREVIMYFGVVEASIPKILKVLPIFIVSATLNTLMRVSSVVLFFKGIKTEDAKWFRMYRLSKSILLGILSVLWSISTYLYFNVEPELPYKWTAYLHPVFTSMAFTLELILIQLYLNIFDANTTACDNEGKMGDDVDKLLEKLKIPRLTIVFDPDEKQNLGEGLFGHVIKGTLINKRNKEPKTQVAVKFLNNEFTTPESLPDLTSEIRTLDSVQNNHENLVRFYGVTKVNSERNLGIVMEYCSLGSLQAYLKTKKSEITEEYTKFEKCPECPKDIQKLRQWAVQVASAMDYLGSINVIHADLAARNVLLDENECAKVTDFGMSLRLYNYQNYVRSNSPVLPWRSMAPEVLSDLQFSTKSDVYSYGVLLWEMYTFGGTPWVGVEWTSNFVGYLKAGNYLQKPTFSSDDLYTKIIRPCLSVDKADRPEFKTILHTFSSED